MSSFKGFGITFKPSPIGEDKHPKVTEWIKKYVHPTAVQPGVFVTYDNLKKLRVLRVESALPTKDIEIVKNRVRFSSNLNSYQDYERILCYLKIDACHHLYLIESESPEKSTGDIGIEITRLFENEKFDKELTLRSVEERFFDWSLFFDIACKEEGYYRIDHHTHKTQYLGSTWNEATSNLKIMGHHISTIPKK